MNEKKSIRTIIRIVRCWVILFVIVSACGNENRDRAERNKQQNSLRQKDGSLGIPLLSYVKVVSTGNAPRQLVRNGPFRENRPLSLVIENEPLIPSSLQGTQLLIDMTQSVSSSGIVSFSVNGFRNIPEFKMKTSPEEAAILASIEKGYLSVELYVAESNGNFYVKQSSGVPTRPQLAPVLDSMLLQAPKGKVGVGAKWVYTSEETKNRVLERKTREYTILSTTEKQITVSVRGAFVRKTKETETLSSAQTRQVFSGKLEYCLQCIIATRGKITVETTTVSSVINPKTMKTEAFEHRTRSSFEIK